MFFALKKLNEEVVSLYEYFCFQTHRFEFQNFFMNYLSICVYRKSISYMFLIKFQNYIFHLIQICSSCTRHVLASSKKVSSFRTNCINQSNTTIWHLGTVSLIYTFIDVRRKTFVRKCVSVCVSVRLCVENCELVGVHESDWHINWSG